MTYKILVIEDDIFSSQVLEAALKRQGYIVYVAPNGLKGLQIVQEQHPDLVLLDLMLPGIDGYEVLNRIRSSPQTATLPVIVVSAKTREDDRDLAQKIGANAYVTKPYQLAELYETVKNVLQKPEAEKKAQSQGQVLVFVSLPRGHAAPVSSALARALRRQLPASDKLLMADLRPFTTEYEQLLDLPARPEPVVMSSTEHIRQWSTLAVRHPEDFFVLYNLSGDAPLGGLTPQNMQLLCDAVLKDVRLALVEVPLQSADMVLQAARRARWLFLVASAEPADLMTARSLLESLKTQHIPSERCIILVKGNPLRELFDTLPAHKKYILDETITPDSPVIQALVHMMA